MKESEKDPLISNKRAYIISSKTFQKFEMSQKIFKKWKVNNWGVSI